MLQHKPVSRALRKKKVKKKDPHPPNKNPDTPPKKNPMFVGTFHLWLALLILLAYIVFTVLIFVLVQNNAVRFGVWGGVTAALLVLSLFWLWLVEIRPRHRHRHANNMQQRTAVVVPKARLMPIVGEHSSAGTSGFRSGSVDVSGRMHYAAQNWDLNKEAATLDEERDHCEQRANGDPDAMKKCSDPSLPIPTALRDRQREHLIECKTILEREGTDPNTAKQVAGYLELEKKETVAIRAAQARTEPPLTVEEQRNLNHRLEMTDRVLLNGRRYLCDPQLLAAGVDPTSSVVAARPLLDPQQAL